jgi:hypothetical protein
MPTDNGIDTRGECSRWLGIDRDGGPSVLAQDAAELRQAARWIGKQHEAHGAQHRVELLIRKGERLAVLDGERDVLLFAETPTCLLKHSRRKVGCDNGAGRPDGLDRRFSGYTGACGNIQHPVIRAYASGPQQARDELTRNAAEGAVIPGGRFRSIRQLLGHQGHLHAGQQK